MWVLLIDEDGKPVKDKNGVDIWVTGDDFIGRDKAVCIRAPKKEPTEKEDSDGQ